MGEPRVIRHPTGKALETSHASPRKLRKMQLSESILRLRRNGLSHKAIGLELGYSEEYVRGVCNWAYDRVAQASLVSTSRILGEEMDRMDGLIRAASAVLVSSRTTPSEKMRALSEIRRCSECKVRWTGAGAPDRLLVGGLGGRAEMAEAEVAGLSDEALERELESLGYERKGAASEGDPAAAAALARAS